MICESFAAGQENIFFDEQSNVLMTAWFNSKSLNSVGFVGNLKPAPPEGAACPPVKRTGQSQVRERGKRKTGRLALEQVCRLSWWSRALNQVMSMMCTERLSSVFQNNKQPHHPGGPQWAGSAIGSQWEGRARRAPT